MIQFCFSENSDKRVHEWLSSRGREAEQALQTGMMRAMAELTRHLSRDRRAHSFFSGENTSIAGGARSFVVGNSMEGRVALGTAAFARQVNAHKAEYTPSSSIGRTVARLKSRTTMRQAQSASKPRPAAHDYSHLRSTLLERRGIILDELRRSLKEALQL